jgi:hypothetical protein
MGATMPLAQQVMLDTVLRNWTFLNWGSWFLANPTGVKLIIHFFSTFFRANLHLQWLWFLPQQLAEGRDSACYTFRWFRFRCSTSPNSVLTLSRNRAFRSAVPWSLDLNLLDFVRHIQHCTTLYNHTMWGPL